jgi:hypothetical protein
VTAEQFEILIEYLDTITVITNRTSDYLILSFFIISITFGYFIGYSLFKK